MSCLKAVRSALVYRKKTRKQDQKKRPIIEHINRETKKIQCMVPCGVGRISKYKEVYRFPLTNSQDNLSQSCEKSRIRSLLLSLTRSDEGASVLITKLAGICIWINTSVLGIYLLLSYGNRHLYKGPFRFGVGVKA